MIEEDVKQDIKLQWPYNRKSLCALQVPSLFYSTYIQSRTEQDGKVCEMLTLAQRVSRVRLSLVPSAAFRRPHIPAEKNKNIIFV